ncbi:SSS family transporter [Dyadobacter sp. BE34]|uniref:SSS family transporter n=1 Tax=Dyadobacter fermentans TaxID=94254 RepID=A0ABU1R2G3_9BACT|nr:MULTISPECIES: sodium:solute symporter family protein [Dyadobacter]MDR6807586.1 SSS family transporter [Dyadobacter fermentans]MDR7045327.1 SSS family transporter [Dyadobacter sp. BE242]MDR7199640.1 SSS family transporter [Dyadobacter sp. BE34]MDR7217901.1 SSS family transporter [Dyadobacter sp. BE31]MDR7265531.1 SSS family transporter [Dyadobacter sp. BE32]
MLAFSILAYLLANLGIGLWASKRITTTQDFVLAGRQLPLILAASATFATWFGSETIMGAPTEFIEHGVLGIIEDPFGASLCLFLVGLFFARRFYKMNIITFCDFFRIRYGRNAELLSAILIIPSYFSWIAAQLLAMGIVLKVVLGWSLLACILASSFVVILYTIWGGMWSISITDFIQTIMIIVGLLIVAAVLYKEVGGFQPLLDAAPTGFFRFFPENTLKGHLEYFAAWITIGLGSIPQQDVFQRVMSAKSARVSVQSTLLSSFMYLTIALLPLFIGLCGHHLYPGEEKDGQMIIPNMVLKHMNLPLQILFFGALVSAILSTTSSAIMAPAVVLGENIFKYFKPDLDDKELLKIIRAGIIGITLVCIFMAATRESIFELVAESSAFSLVSLFVPLAAGLYWKSSTPLGCMLSMVIGLAVWLFCVFIETEYPALVYGLLASFLGMVAGWIREKIRRSSDAEPSRIS